MLTRGGVKLEVKKTKWNKEGKKRKKCVSKKKMPSLGFELGPPSTPHTLPANAPLGLFGYKHTLQHL